MSLYLAHRTLLRGASTVPKLLNRKQPTTRLTPWGRDRRDERALSTRLGRRTAHHSSPSPARGSLKGTPTNAHHGDRRSSEPRTGMFPAKSPRAANGGGWFSGGSGPGQQCRCSNRAMLATLLFVMALAAVVVHEVRGRVSGVRRACNQHTFGASKTARTSALILHHMPALCH